MENSIFNITLLSATVTKKLKQFNTPYIRLPIGLIVADENYRTATDTSAIAELAKSIEQNGLLHPPSVTYQDDEIKLLAGNRRLEALKLNGQEQVVCRLFAPSFADSIKLSENLHRSNPNAMDTATYFQSMLEEHSPEEISHIVCKSKKFITHRLQLLNLIEPIKKMVYNKTIGLAAATSISKMPIDQQKIVLKKFGKDNNGELIPWQHQQVKDYQKSTASKMLSTATFDTADAELISDRKDCASCIFNSTAPETLFDDIGSTSRCMNPTCWNKKTSAHLKNLNEKYLGIIKDEQEPIYLAVEYYGKSTRASLLGVELEEDIAPSAAACNSWQSRHVCSPDDAEEFALILEAGSESDVSDMVLQIVGIKTIEREVGQVGESPGPGEAIPGANPDINIENKTLDAYMEEALVLDTAKSDSLQNLWDNCMQSKETFISMDIELIVTYMLVNHYEEMYPGNVTTPVKILSSYNRVYFSGFVGSLEKQDAIDSNPTGWREDLDGIVTLSYENRFANLSYNDRKQMLSHWLESASSNSDSAAFMFVFKRLKNIITTMASVTSDTLWQQYGVNHGQEYDVPTISDGSNFIYEVPVNLEDTKTFNLGEEEE